MKSFNKNGYVNDPSYSIYQLKVNHNSSYEFKLSHQYGSRNHKSFYEYQKTFDRMHLKRLPKDNDFNSTNKEYYIIVAYDEPPYLFVEELSSDDETICSIESMICYEIDSTDRLPRDFFDLLSKNESKIIIGGIYGKFKKRCCYGISISILNIINTKLKEIGQKELKFYLYVLKHSISKLMNKTNKLLNLADEVVFDLFTFQADFTIAPLSFNRRQEEFIDFTSEFYHDDFVVIGKRDFGNASLLAFLAPFEWSIWIGIFLTLTFAALVQTIYEWISPYGLTPRGRNRVQIWSLASALTLNWSVLFSHTFKTKSPKCWANRFDY